MFQAKTKTVAGFAENQGYGLGTNSMTEDEKSILIYGALFFFFGLFLAGKSVPPSVFFFFCADVFVLMNLFSNDLHEIGYAFN